jgi:23S rRNA (guanosine2251-2'-O)-methyltransferase
MPAWDFDFTQRVCVVIGSEGEGVHRLVRERCDARVHLPVKGHIASLNASAAASALLYEISRQRANQSDRPHPPAAPATSPQVGR